MADDTTPILLVDRAAKGGFEVWYDGRPHVFPRGCVEFTAYSDLARHVFTHEHEKVWTKDGAFLHRVAVKDAPGFPGVAARLAQHLGEEILDQDPIEIDSARVEGWSLEGQLPGRRLAVQVDVPASDFRERLGNARDPGALAARG